MRWVGLACLVAVAAFVLYPLWQVAGSSWATYRNLPQGRDPKLLGVWEGKLDGKSILYQFRTDGTAIRSIGSLDKVSMKLKWGTENGQLVLSWSSIDSGPRFGKCDYKVSAEGKRIETQKSNSINFPLELSKVTGQRK